MKKTPAPLSVDAFHRLIRRMSSVCERCYWWRAGAEFDIWTVIQQDPVCRTDGLSAEDITALRRLAGEAGGWVAWRDNGRSLAATFVPLAEWRAEHAAGVTNTP